MATRHGAMSTTQSYSSRKGQRAPENMVHADRIRRETIRKELESLQLYTHFTINPYRPGHAITGKPNSFYDAEFECGPEDPEMTATLAKARSVPTAKYDSPQTTSHEYGWYSTPLLDDGLADVRTGHHVRHNTEVTRIKEVEWKSGLTRNITNGPGARSASRRSRPDGSVM